MDELEPVPWDYIDRAFDRTFYNCPAAFEAHREQFDAGWWQGLMSMYDAWKSEYKRDGDPDHGAAYLLAYFAERGSLTIGPNTTSAESLAGLRDRRLDTDTLEQWFWDERRTMWAIAVRTGTHFALVKYWLREDDVPLMVRNFGPESRGRLAEFDRGDAGGETM